MPRLRRLSGSEVIAIFRKFGFEVVRIKGSHHTLQRRVGDIEQTITVPMHGHKGVALGTLKGLYRKGCEFIPEQELQLCFYSD